MWGLKGVAWQPPPALRNGRHTRHTHTPLRPPSPRPSLSLSLSHPSSHLFPPSSSSSFHRAGAGMGGRGVCAPYPAHNTYPTPYTSRVWGKFLNFARIENFHILFPRRRGAARCWLQPGRLSSLSFSSACDSCNRSEKFPKAMPPPFPAFPDIVSGPESTSAASNPGLTWVKSATENQSCRQLRGGLKFREWMVLKNVSIGELWRR